MNRYVIIANGAVTNVVLWDGAASWKPPTGSTAKLVPDNSPVSSGWAFDGANFTAPAQPAPPPPTLSQQMQAALSAGLTINSTSTPALNGVYAVDQNAEFNIASVINYITVNGVFPGKAAVYPWADMAGNFHVLPNVAVFKAMATAIADYVSQWKLYAAGAPGVSQPSSTATIG